MGVRPPTDNNGDTELIEFGIAALDAELDNSNIEFPATHTDVIEALDDETIEYDAAGHTVRLSTALERTDQSEFESKRALLNALHPVFEDLRSSTGTGFIGWLRSLFR